MKTNSKNSIVRSVALAASLVMASAVVFAADAPAPTGTVQKGKAAATTSAPAMATMDAKIQGMHDMHAKMMAAQTPQERNALMNDQMKVMQDAMATMGAMGMMGGNAGMGAKGGMGMGPMGAGQGQMPADMGARQQMMEKRMEMMASMMQMMMDRMAPVPATK